MSEQDPIELEPNPIIRELKKLVKSEGYDPNSADFERRLDQYRVIRCREMQGVPHCAACPAYDGCETIKRVLRMNRGYGE